MIDRYIEKYCEGFEFKPYKKESQEICGITVENDIFLFEKGINRRTKSHAVFRKGDMVYECDRVDTEMPILSSVTIDGKQCLCFSKCLYGFVFLNTENLQVEYEYFPKKVLDGEESFIVVEARNLGGLIIFDGCYWACPYAIFAYDHEKRKFFPLSEEFGLIYDVEGSISDQRITLTGRDLNERDIEVTLTEQEVRSLLNEKGTGNY